MKKFELFMCCLGNGTTVCNKAVEEYGDYKIIAHIADCGKITWYVKPGYVPGADLAKIEHTADTSHANWENWLHSMPEIKQYEYLLGNVPWADASGVMHSDMELWQKCHELEQAYYNNAH